MRIIVTGSAGFLGSHLADSLLEDGHTVLGIDNLSGGDMENVFHDFVKADTSDFEKMDEIIKEFKPDIVYHCACSAHEGFSLFSPHYITKNTFGNTMAILSACARNNVKRFIYTSSMSRYGAIKAPFHETDTPKPEGPYATAKLACEIILKQLGETHNMEYAIAIPHNIIGTRQKYDDPFRNVAAIFINRNLQGKPAIIYGDGLQQRSFSFVEDCIFSMKKMIDCKSGEIYNIGPDEKDGEITTVKELAEIIADLTGFKGQPIHRPDRPREVKISHCSSDKIRKDFGYQTKTSLRDGLKEMVDYIYKNGTKEFQYNIPVEIINDKTPSTWVNKEI